MKPKTSFKRLMMFAFLGGLLGGASVSLVKFTLAPPSKPPDQHTLGPVSPYSLQGQDECHRLAEEYVDKWVNLMANSIRVKKALVQDQHEQIDRSAISYLDHGCPISVVLLTNQAVYDIERNGKFDKTQWERDREP